MKTLIEKKNGLIVLILDNTNNDYNITKHKNINDDDMKAKT